MRLVLQVPAEWQHTQVAGQDVVVVPGFVDRPDLALAYGPMIGYPINDAGWIESTLRVEAANAKLEISVPIESRAVVGWPFKLFEATAYVADKAVEYRMAAFFRCLEWGGAVIVRGGNRARFEEHKARILEVLRSADMDTSGGIHCVRDLFTGMSDAESEASHGRK